MTWLVTGGAGYIGSHVLDAFRRQDLAAVAFDDLSSGRAERLHGAELVEGDIADTAALRGAFRRYEVRGVVHLAAKKDVAESVADPLRYYRENVEGTRRLLEAMAEESVDRIVFSSSAAVYGGDHAEPVDETAPCFPANPYGRTKLIGEQLIADTAAATGLRWVSLRYFNVAGAGPGLEADRDSPSLVASAIRAVATGGRPTIYGDDYATPDGTGVRDYVHVVDVARAHVAAALALEAGRVTGLTANVGTGVGYSVREVIEVVRRTASAGDPDASTPTVLGRRAGDVARSLADVRRIRVELDWQAEHGLEDMVRSTAEALGRPAG